MLRSFYDDCCTTTTTPALSATKLTAADRVQEKEGQQTAEISTRETNGAEKDPSHTHVLMMMKPAKNDNPAKISDRHLLLRRSSIY
jgi:hypothetical protein